MNKDDALQVFSFEEKQIRVVPKDGQPWWVAKDVCDVLEHSNSRKAIELLDDDEKGVSKVYTPGGMQDMSVINESGLYALIIRSNKPEAKKFRKWVTSEVLPSIRRGGGYSAPGSPSDIERKKADAQLQRANAMLNNSKLRIAKFVRETVKDVWEYLSPEARQSYSAYVSETATGQPGLIPLPVVEKSYTASELAAEFGVSAWKIGHAANGNGLKAPEYGFEVLDKARGHGKQVSVFRHNEAGRAKLARLFRSQGEPGK
ncbi:MAG: Bro-N domain-containing protein [Synergistaceae bacterium]|nr:Bro-N domain-containing protein [Synergistaceae bacterium]